MDLRILRYFIAVYEEKNITAASKICHVAQPSISLAINQLEGTLSHQLFFRHKKGVTPTEAGERLYPLARKLVNEASAIEDSFRKDFVKPELSISLLPTLEFERVGQLIRLFKDNIKDLQLRLVESQEKSDLRIISDVCCKDGDNFIPLWKEHYVLALPLDHFLLLKDEIELNDLHQIPFVERVHCEFRAMYSQVQHEGNLTVDIRAKVTTEEWALQLVKMGIGVCIVPESTIKNRTDIATRKIQELHGLIRLVGVSYPKSDSYSSVMETAIALCNQMSML
jgi:DNA-binding transcriptional LysR family regulator